MQVTALGRGSARIAVHALGNVCLGIAIGLLGYYLLTDATTSLQQSGLQRAFPISAEVPSAPPKQYEWDGWEREDEAYWKALGEGEAFGRIRAKAMRLDAVVVKGTSRSDLMKGPGWITYTDLPGPSGNCGISGHRTTYGAPFRRLDRLKRGDIVTLASPYRLYTYQVRRVFVVTPDTVDVVETTEEPTLTMTACHPPYSARQRLIVQSDLISVRKIER